MLYLWFIHSNYENKLSISDHSIDAFLMKADRGEYEVRK